MPSFRTANMLMRRGETQEAIKQYQACIRDDSSVYSVYENLGWALEHEGRVLEAIKAYQKAVQLFPGAARATHALRGLGQYIWSRDGLEDFGSDSETDRCQLNEPSDQKLRQRPLSKAEASLLQGSCFNGVELFQNYSQSALCKTPDTFALVRIIGNDLPPRHDWLQSITNVEFILQHEPELPHCKNVWILNRIYNTERLHMIKELLHAYHCDFIEIPFLADEFIDVEWDFSQYPEPGFLWSKSYYELSPEKQLMADVAAYRRKNLYLMNNNGARNRAILEGRLRAKWVLPWDGNCIMNIQGWEELTRAVLSRPFLKYFVVPMQRLTQNLHYLDECLPLDPSEEPQLIFRTDATEHFEPEYPYGRRPKVNFFWRLGIPGVWDTWKDDPWDLPRPKPSSEKGEYGLAGYTFRLASSPFNSAYNVDNQLLPTSRRERNQARLKAIADNIEDVEQSTLRANPLPHIGCYSDAVLGLSRIAFLEAPSSDLGRLSSKIVRTADLISMPEVNISPHAAELAISSVSFYSTGVLNQDEQAMCQLSIESLRITDRLLTLALAWRLKHCSNYVKYAVELIASSIDGCLITCSGKALLEGQTMLDPRSLFAFLSAVNLIRDSNQWTAACEDNVYSKVIALCDEDRKNESNILGALTNSQSRADYSMFQASLYAYIGDFAMLLRVFLRLNSLVLDEFAKVTKGDATLSCIECQGLFHSTIIVLRTFRIIAAAGGPRINHLSETASLLTSCVSILARDYSLPPMEPKTAVREQALISALFGIALDLNILSYTDAPFMQPPSPVLILGNSFDCSGRLPAFWNLSFLARHYPRLSQHCQND